MARSGAAVAAAAAEELTEARLAEMNKNCMNRNGLDALALSVDGVDTLGRTALRRSQTRQ